MRKVMILLFAALLQFSWAGLTINGTIKNAQGKTPKFADAHLMLLGENVPLKSVHADKQGNFIFDAEDGKIYTLNITAADHQGLNIPILSDNKNQTIEIEIQLQANNYKEDFSEVKIIGDWNKFNFRNAEKMERRDDGTFKYTVTGDAEKVAYQLLDIDSNGHSVNGTMNDDFEYDGGGDYRSIVKTAEGKVDIIFDPQKVFRSGGSNQANVAFKNNDPQNKIWQLEKKSSSDVNKFRAERSAYYAKHKNLDGFSFDFSNLLAFLEKEMDSKEKLISRYAAAKYVGILDAAQEDGNFKKVANLLSIADPLWALNPFSLVSTFTQVYGAEKANEKIAKEFDTIPSKNVQAKVLVIQGMDAKSKNNMDLVGEIYNTLIKDYPEQKNELRWYLGELDPNKAITKGKQVPEFNVQLIHSDEMVSRESMLGTFYLLDFWAVWCGPCRAEMPNIHDAYKEFKSDKFEILSLSFDPKISAVDKYRKETWPMPWLHTFVEKGFKNELSKRFEVNGIPKPILVNDKGIIIATGSELRGSELKKTLNKFLNTTM